ncbi:MAG TPA: hypothetical protein VMR50_17855 [Myxococcota bacterium]|nr:hypothetical protein [Myxococcota bacterium]
MLALALALGVFLAQPPQIVKLEPSRAQVEVRDVSAQNGVVSGTLLNQTDTPVHDVSLLVQYHYRWPNEFKPGKNDPGRGETIDVPTEIPPGGRVTFSQPSQPPKPLGDGGHFETIVTVIAFEQTLPPASPAPPGQGLELPVPETRPSD